ncbi:hypothetical protein C8J56DRAFT_782683 [Mycena floridula]|nr:hypothetical protein C8J56DRAFT_782683 [Mycena floridula]
MTPIVFLRLISFLLFCSRALTRLVNVTVDDADSSQSASWVYSPSGAWNSAGLSCVNCTARPDVSKMYSGTWHDSTFNSQPGSNNFPNQVLFASLTFNGTAVYVYVALANTLSSPTGNSDMSFLVDGVLLGTFVRPAPGEPGYLYNVPVFSVAGLSSGVHTLTIENGHVDGLKSLILLDYVVYT